MSQLPSISSESRPRGIGDPCLDAYARELDYLTRTLLRLGVSEIDSEDLAHEVFLILRRNWRDYDATRPLRPFLFGIAFRVAASHRRKRWREVPFAVVDEPDRGPSPDRVFEASQARAIVLEALSHVPLKRRAVLILHDIDEVSMQDIAAELSIPLFTAYSRLRKARRELESAVNQMRRRDFIR